jgi:hypothetical protein
MYLVAQCAFLGGRWVLPQEWAAFFGVAGIAVVIDAKLLQGCISYRTMRIVAVTTDNLAFADWMAEGPEGLGLFAFMAGVTDIGLFLSIQHAVRFMYLVTVDAGRIFSFVRAGMPFGKFSSLVTLLTHRVASVAR